MKTFTSEDFIIKEDIAGTPPVSVFISFVPRDPWWICTAMTFEECEEKTKRFIESQNQIRNSLGL